MTEQEKLMYKLMRELRGESLSKAAFATGDMPAGSIKRADADRFINLMVDQSTLLKAIRVVRTDSPSGTFSKLDVSGPVTRIAAQGTDPSDTRKPTNTVVSYAVAKTISCLDITGEVMEDNPEGESGKNTILDAMLMQIGNDMEQLAIEGDSSISGTSDEELLLKANDGFLKLTASGTGAHQVDAAGDAPSTQLLKAMLKKLPTRYRRDKNKLRWIMSENTALVLSQQLTNAGNANAFRSALGDSTLVDGGLPKIHGISPLIVPLMPEDLTIDGTSGDAGAAIWLCDPMNLIYVVLRDLAVEWMRQPRKDTDEATITMRTDFCVENTDAVVRAMNVNLEDDAAYYGVSA